MSEQQPARRVLVAIPTRQPSLTVGTAASLFNEIYALGNAGMALTFFNWSGDPLIAHARNVILAQFLQTDCTDLVFVDDDVSWEPGAMLRLLNHPVDLVAGIYRHKKDPESYPLNLLSPNLADLKQDRNTGLLLVADVPFGFCRVSRACAELIYEAAKDKPFRHQSAPELPCRVVFEDRYEPPKDGDPDGRFFGEDFSFCQTWRDLGGEVWLDPSFTLTHHGAKDYRGNVGAWLRRGAQAEADPNDPEVIRKAFREVAAALKPAEAA